MGDEMTADIWQGLERERTCALAPEVPACDSSRWIFSLVESGRLVSKHIKTVFCNVLRRDNYVHWQGLLAGNLILPGNV